jgi:hypothetical protein
LLRIRSLAGSTIDTPESRFRKRQASARSRTRVAKAASISLGGRRTEAWTLKKLNGLYKDLPTRRKLWGPRQVLKLLEGLRPIRGISRLTDFRHVPVTVVKTFPECTDSVLGRSRRDLGSA